MWRLCSCDGSTQPVLCMLTFGSQSSLVLALSCCHIVSADAETSLRLDFLAGHQGICGTPQHSYTFFLRPLCANCSCFDALFWALVPSLLNIYQALKNLICLRLCLFSKVFDDAVFPVCGPVSQWSRIYGAEYRPAQSLHRWCSCRNKVWWGERHLAKHRPLADRLLRHQGMAHRKTLTSLMSQSISDEPQKSYVS